MNQLKFNTLEALIAHTKQKRHQNKPKPKVVTPEDRIANALAKKIADELLWQPRAIVLLTQHQHCRCGQCYRAVVGSFVEMWHSKHNGRKLTRIVDASKIDKLPHRMEEFNERIAVCPHCMLERDVAEALINPIHDVTVQLPLFDHVLQQGEFPQ